MTEREQPIDFVLTWVDGRDPAWREEKRRYAAAEPGMSSGDANEDVRYRDNGLLKYWFRGVERFAPWVRQVFFVTCGQKPEWLDERHPKLRLVDHRDYIPAEYLPTFQSNTIELNLHRLAGLSEHFVLFNDDTFALQPLAPRSFFRGGLPVLPCDLGIPRWLGCTQPSHVVVNNSGVLKKCADVNRGIWRNWRKFFSVPSLGPARAARNFVSFAVNRTMLQGCFGHIPLPHLKSTLAETWERAPAVLDRTCRHRFRADDGVNHWLACALNLVEGRFVPANEKRLGRQVAVSAATLAEVCAGIRGGRYPMICLGDPAYDKDIDLCFTELGKAFAGLLPEKSAFEK